MQKRPRFSISTSTQQNTLLNFLAWVLSAFVKVRGECETLRGENEALRRKNEALGCEKERQSSELEKTQAQLKKSQARVVHLETQKKQDSHNSHKPPSTDSLSKKKVVSLRKRSGRKPGGQPGHKGCTLEWSDNPDKIVMHAVPEVCPCGLKLDVDPAQFSERRQVKDVPPVQMETTEHRTQRVHCPCGRVHESRFPDEVKDSVQYGPNIQVQAVYLTHYQLLPVDRTRQLLSEWYGACLSVGTIQAWAKRLGKQIAPLVKWIKIQITQSPVVHFDESGLRVAKIRRWLHTAATALFTWYGCHDKRGWEAMDEHGILPKFKGTAVHDGFSAYRKYGRRHALCNAHHLRELIALLEATGQKWIEKLIRLLCKAQKAVVEAGPQGLDQKRIRYVRKRFLELLREGFRLNPPAMPPPGQKRRPKQTPTVNLLLRLRQYVNDVLRFTTDPNVPFDNNEAERAIRMPKLKQKISGGFRTVKNAHLFCDIRSLLATLKKQSLPLLSSLILAFQDPFELVIQLILAE